MSNESKKTLLIEGVVAPTMQKVIVNTVEKGITTPTIQPVSPIGERGATVPTMQPVPNASASKPAPTTPAPAQNSDSGQSGKE